MSDFRRARQPEQKEARRAHVLSTARAMLEAGTPIGDLTLNELARRAGMAKSNIYRYFETREAVLLALLRDEWTAWSQAMASSYRKPPRRREALPALIHHVAHTLARRPLLCALTSALPGVVERNLSEGAIHEFKLSTLELFRHLGRFLATCAPDLSEAACTQLVHDSVVLVSGLYPFAHPSPIVARVQRAPELAFFRRSFEKDLERLMLALARGLAADA